jgi:hypothetical protein
LALTSPEGIVSTVAVRQFCRRLAIVSLAALVIYVTFAAVASIFPDVQQLEGAWFWPAFLPDWPVALLVALAVALAVCDVVLWLASLSATRSERERLQGLASDWPFRADAKLALAKGDPDLTVTDFRGHPLPGGAQLAWAAPASTFDRILVLRSREAFALSPRLARHQSVAYEGVEAGFSDEGLTPGRVYFYTAFAEARGAGEWSPPAWTSVTTPEQRLRDAALRDLWTLRG